MARSVMGNGRGCYVCGDNSYLESHHIFFGGRNRHKAEQDGLKVLLCYEHHRGTSGVHGRDGHELDLKLKRDAEGIWLKRNNKTIQDFIDRYGRNYLDADIND